MSVRIGKVTYKDGVNVRVLRTPPRDPLKQHILEQVVEMLDASDGKIGGAAFVIWDMHYNADAFMYTDNEIAHQVIPEMVKVTLGKIPMSYVMCESGDDGGVAS